MLAEIAEPSDIWEEEVVPFELRDAVLPSIEPLAELGECA